MTTGSCSSTPNAREWDEEEEQGPRVSYSGEQGWGATHRKWRRSGWDTQTVHAVGITRPWCVPCTSERMGNKGEEIRGCARRGRRAGGRVPKRRKKGEDGGSGTRDLALGSRANRMLGKKEKHTVHKDGKCGTMPRPCKNGVLNARYRQCS